MRKHLARRDICSCTQGFHLSPDVAPVQGFACPGDEYRAGLNALPLSVSPQLLAQASVLNKEVYAWTINDEKSMKRMMKLQVSGIITDNTYFTSYILNTKGQSEWVMNLAEKVL